jgi:hypothetical protein
MTLVMWPDDFLVNACPGAKRVLGLRKGTNNPETFFWQCPKRDIRKYAGRPILFGALVYQKARSGAGTWRLVVTDDSGNTIAAGAPGTGSSSGSGYPLIGNYEFQVLQTAIPSNLTGFNLSLSLEGAAGDVYYVALPTATLSQTLTPHDLGPNDQEMILAVNHWNPHLLTPLARQFPGTAFAASGGTLYGFTRQDLEALSAGVVHASVKAVKAKIELYCPVPGTNLMCGSAIDASSLTFGPQVFAQQFGRNLGAGWWPLDPDGCVAIVVDTPNALIGNATFDFDWVLA